MGIFEKHKLMFSFQMTVMIMDGEGEIDHDELAFFMKGNTSLSQVASKPAHLQWFPDMGWKDLQLLVHLRSCFSGLLDDLNENTQVGSR